MSFLKRLTESLVKESDNYTKTFSLVYSEDAEKFAFDELADVVQWVSTVTDMDLYYNSSDNPPSAILNVTIAPELGSNFDSISKDIIEIIDEELHFLYDDHSDTLEGVYVKELSRDSNKRELSFSIKLEGYGEPEDHRSQGLDYPSTNMKIHSFR